MKHNPRHRRARGVVVTSLQLPREWPERPAEAPQPGAVAELSAANRAILRNAFAVMFRRAVPR